MMRVTPEYSTPLQPRQRARWHAHARPVANPRLHLICCSCAGGGAIAYRGWGAMLANDVALWPLQTPGRGQRMDEPLITDLHDLVDTLFQDIKHLLAEPHILFGHSMGAAVAYELARRAEDDGLPSAQLLAVSARYAPHVAPRSPVSTLDDDAMIERIGKLGGTPPELFASPEMLAMLLPIFRADFCANDSFLGRVRPIRAPIAAYGGTQDITATAQDLQAWAAHTTGRFVSRQFSGGHFFLNDAPAPLLDQIFKDAA